MMKSPVSIRKKSANTPGTATATQAPPAPAISVTAHSAPQSNGSGAASQFPAPPPPTQLPETSESVDLERRQQQLAAKVAELQWDLGGLVYEMAIRNRLRPDVIVKRAAALQDVDAELGEVERILRMERTGVAALCLTCGAPHSAGAVYCWQCGSNLLEKVSGTTIAASPRG